MLSGVLRLKQSVKQLLLHGTMVFSWFKKMISIPSQGMLTKTASFTQWTALVAYGGGGLVLLCAPSLWSMLLAFDLNRRVEGYIRLSGVNLLALSFIYIVVARAGSCVSKHGATLSSIFERLVFVNGFLLMLIFRGMLPLYFALLFVLLDTTLSLATLCVWIKETPGASFVLYFNEVLISFKSCPWFNKSSLFVQIIGFLQFCGGLIFMAFLSLIQDALKLDPFEEQAEGFLSCCFLLFAIHGWFHAVAGGAELAAFTTAAIFYRLSFTIPLQYILYLCNQIELNLFILFGSCEGIFALVLLLSCLYEKNKRKTRIRVFKDKPEQFAGSKPEILTINDSLEEMAQDVNHP